MDELRRMTASELVANYSDKTLSPVEATRAVLEAIDTYEDQVNAWVLVDAEGALAQAGASETRWANGRPLGPADGVPTAIKDIFLTAGWPTLRGSKLVDANGPWTEDAPAVARLRESGAVFVGKTTTPEFAWKGVTDSPRHGATGNPWRAGLTAGGSSGGSATAVGLGMAAWSVGTDGGGSVRIPAAFTGTVALKPTYGLVPMYPASPFGTLAHAGPMVRSVTDAARMMDILTGFDHRDWSALPTPAGSFSDGLEDGVDGLRVAFSADLGFVDNDAEVEAAVRAAASVLAHAGATVEEIDPGFTDPVDAFDVLWSAGAAKVLQPYGDAALEQVDPGLADCVRRGQSVTGSQYLDATAARMSLGQLMGRLHRTWDVLITPTVPITAFGAGRDAPEGWASPRWTSWTPYTYPFNMTQQPALSVPCGFSDAGLPIGMQVVGPRHGDARVLQVGRAYERAGNWSQPAPQVLS